MHAHHSAPEMPSALLQHAEFLRRLARSLVRDENAADDLVQETWVQALQHPPRYGTRDKGLRGWLGTITRNLAANDHRSRTRRRLREASVASSESQSSENHELQQEGMRMVVDALLELDQPYRDTLWMRFFRELSVAEIAREQAVAEATVRSRISRGLGKLRARFREEGDPRQLQALLAVAGEPVLSGSSASLSATWLVPVLAAGAIWGVATWDGQRSKTNAPNAGSTQLAALKPALAPSELLAQQPKTARAALTLLDETERSSAEAASLLEGSVLRSAYAPLDLQATPASDVEVQLSYSLDQRWTRTRVRTDEDGTFRLPSSAFGESEPPAFIHVRVPGDDTYRSQFTKVSWSGEGYGIVELRQVAHGIVPGVVVDRQGEPLESVEIRLAARVPDEPCARGTTDAEGGFLLRVDRAVHHLEAILPGHVPLLLGKGLTPLSEGGYAPLRISLVPEAKIELRLIDASGNPVPEARVVAMPSEPERIGETAGIYTAPQGITDENGRVTLASCWSGVHLDIFVGFPGMARYVFTAQGGSGVLIEGRSEGSPILLGEGESLELQGQLARRVKIDTVAVDLQGRPVAEARWRLTDRGKGSPLGVVASGKTDAEGRLQASLLPLPLVGPLHLDVQAGEDSPTRGQQPEPLSESEGALRGLGYAAEPTPAPDLRVPVRCSMELPLPSTGAPLQPTVVLRRTSTWAARVFREDGRELEFVKGTFEDWRTTQDERWRARLEGPQGPVPLTWGQQGMTASNLLEAPYLLRVEERSQTSPAYCLASYELTDLQPSASPFRLELTAPERTRIRVQAAGSAAGPSELLIGRLSPAGTPPAPASQDQRVQTQAHWPTYCLPPFAYTYWTEPAGDYWFWIVPMDGQTLEVSDLAVGWYRFGLLSRDEQGHACAPIATDWAYYGTDDHLIEFQARKTGILTGQLIDEGTPRFWALTLVAQDGTVVPLVPNARLESMYRVQLDAWDLGADGSFRQENVPVGDYRLRAGTRDQLRKGIFEREVQVTIRPGETTEVEL